MRILVTTHYALPHKGGIEVLVHELSHKWRTRGYSVVHQTSKIAPVRTEVRDVKTPSDLFAMPANNILEKFDIPFPIFNPFQLNRVLNRLVDDADVVNVQGMLYMNSVMAAWLARRKGKPVVLSEYPGFVRYNSRLVNWIEQLAFATLGRFCAGHSDTLVVINRCVAHSLRRYIPPDLPVELIPVGVDTAHFAPATAAGRAELRRKWNLKKPAVLFAGRLVVRKGIELLNQIPARDFDLIVCGRGDRAITNPTARFLGFVSDQELLELYQACDAFLLLTDGDDFPLVGLETMACGLPLIAFDTPANREYHDETTAILVEPSLDGVVGGIQSLVQNTAVRETMAAAARTRAIERHDWSITATRYLDLFERLVSSQDG